MNEKSQSTDTLLSDKENLSKGVGYREASLHLR